MIFDATSLCRWALLNEERKNAKQKSGFTIEKSTKHDLTNVFKS